MFVTLSGLPTPRIPFGSPNPPVCTSRAGRSSVGFAELPVENVPVRTSMLGAGAFSTASLIRARGLERSITSGTFTSAIFNGSGGFSIFGGSTFGGSTTQGFRGGGATILSTGLGSGFGCGGCL
jgi:hypothetical protein